MKSPGILLLTVDRTLQKLVAEVLPELDGVIHVASEIEDALDLICQSHDINLVMIDFANGPHGLRRLRAIRALDRHVPLIVITDQDQKQVEALAYANGATAGIHRSALRAQLAVGV